MGEIANRKGLIPSSLNDGQKDAYKKIRDFLESPSDGMFLLEGYAGTGKTYIMSKIIEYLADVHPLWRIAVTAPTNKAVKVLKRSGRMDSPKVRFQTIHKMLGLTEEITADGKQIFTRKGIDNCDIESYNVVIVDEVSMLNDELFIEIAEHAGHIKIIFTGDPAQIPPVGRLDCIPFKAEKREEYNISMCMLTEIMRQNMDNPIVNAGFLIRNDLSNPSSAVERRTVLNELDHGIDFIDFGDPVNRERLLGLFEQYFACEKFDENPDYAKVIAWRNVTIDKLNGIIRGLIYKNEAQGAAITKIMIGEKLVANKPITDAYNVIIFNTNDEFDVLSYSILTRTYATDREAIKLEYYNAKVQFYDIKGKRQFRVVDILHESSEEKYYTVLNALKQDAISKKGQGLEAKKAWRLYYEYMRQFADVKYNYAITCHKAQGSTYTNVFVMEDDINRNQDVFERNRIKYTAFTRPTEKLFIVKQ